MKYLKSSKYFFEIFQLKFSKTYSINFLFVLIRVSEFNSFTIALAIELTSTGTDMPRFLLLKF